MTIRAEVDGVGVLEFPDGTSPSIIQATVKRVIGGNQKPSPGEDVARTIAPALTRGVTNLAGMPGDLWNMISSGAANAVGYLGEKTGLADPGFRKRLMDVAKPELPMPTSGGLLRGIESQTGPLYRPQTTPGKLAGGLLEGAASSPFGRAMTGMGAISGLASEGAGVATEGSAIEPYARFGAGLLAAPAFQAGKNWKDIPGKMIRESTGDMTPAQFAEAQAQLDRARKYGIDLAAAEALPPSSIQQLMSDVAASKSGGSIVNEFMAKRPEQIKTAVRDKLLAGIGQANPPDVNMARAKQAATDVISNAEKARSAAVRPFYDAARKEFVPNDALEEIKRVAAANNPFLDSVSKNAAQGFVDEVMTTAKNPAIPNNAAALDKVYQATRNRIELPPIGAKPEEKTAAAALKPLNSLLDEALRAESPSIKAGREKYSQITKDVIDPLNSGPVGRVAGKQGFDPSEPQNLNPIASISNERIARPASIGELYTKLGTVDKQAFPGIARTWLENAFDAATQRVQAGENRMMGANFAKAVYGTDQQIANFQETMRGVALSNGAQNPEGFVNGAKNLMEILQLTGKVPGLGSPTGGRIAANEMARSSVTAGALETVSAAPGRPLANKLRDWAMQGNYKKLAEVLTDPDSIKKIELLGKYKPDTTTAQALAIGLLNANAQ